MKYFDTHAHYLAKRFNRDRDKLLGDIHAKGVEYIVNSTNGKELEQGLQLARKYDFVYLSILSDGYYFENADLEVHQSRINEAFERTIAKTLRICEDNKKIVAWGEFGCDFRRTEPTKEEVKKQSFWFRKDCEAAKQLKLPVVIHSGNACQLVFDLLKEADMPDYGHGKGMIHSYLGSPKMALDYAAMGYFLSITGVVTHGSPRGKNLVEVVKKVPLKHLVIETDSPYLTPEPFRNERNDSGKLKMVVKKIAEIKSLSPEEVAAATMDNAKALFGIK